MFSNMNYFLGLLFMGAGSAGSVVASRLSEDECVKVLLLEAGGKVYPVTEIPALTFLSTSTDMDWQYKTVPQARAAGGYEDRKLPYPRGKGLGGSSLLNFMLYVRGNKRDYDFWETLGATGWSWKNVFPYFLKSEDNTDPQIANNGYHATGGYLTISSPEFTTTIKRTFQDGLSERGYEYRDINGESQTGSANFQATMRDGTRCSTAKAFLMPAEERKNLHIVNQALVRRILFNDKKKKPLVLNFKFRITFIRYTLEKEVIVSGGTINSPQILMLSGIGPKNHLNNFGDCVDLVQNTEAFKKIGAKMFETKFPGCESHELYSDAYLRCIARNYAFNFYHPVGTCKMGDPNDDTTVVDPRLR
ncbi:glucose dehydrogenase [Caerostris extrusa]|uniref:Glucose dehydrogenase n=1 Tax=Caerostris extrusa TaxID=172846 RepID=A0AAV4WSV6_CAEEX|nr:glucose dehydrogenase [Caerostris extrusa]